MDVKRVSTRVEIKDGDTGEFVAVIATLNVKDSDGDVTPNGAFHDGEPIVVSAYGHSSWMGALPVGDAVVQATEDKRRSDYSLAKVAGQFYLDTADGKDTFTTVKNLAAKGLGEWCADEETEILTERGWLRYDQLTTSDRAYTLNVDTGTARFEDVQAVNVWARERRTMRLIETGGFSALTTAAHRWPVRFVDGHLGWRRTEDLATSNAILRTAPRADAPAEAKWSDAFVELVAWYWTEGNHSRQAGCVADTVYIAQSGRANAHHVAAIRAALAVAFPGQWSEYVNPDGMVRFRLRAEAGGALMGVTDEAKTPTADFLLSLSTAQLRLLVERCMDGDGHTSAIGTRLWYQVDPHAVGMFEMACALAGIPTASRQAKNYGNRFGRVPRTVSLLRNVVATPLASISVKWFNNRPRRTVAVDEWVPYDGHVWCPTTPSGTWLARRRGSVYFTGNSYGYDPLKVSFGDFEGDRVRFLEDLKVFEASPVLQGAGVDTRTVLAKALKSTGLTDEQVAQILAAVRSEVPSAQTLADQLKSGVDALAGLIDGAARVGALRAEVGKPLSAVNQEILKRAQDQLTRIVDLVGVGAPADVDTDDATQREYLRFIRSHT